jgi:hypothetical protein
VKSHDRFTEVRRLYRANGERVVALAADQGRTHCYSRRSGITSRPFFVIIAEERIESFPEEREICWSIEHLTDSGETYQG